MSSELGRASVSAIAIVSVSSIAIGQEVRPTVPTPVTPVIEQFLARVEPPLIRYRASRHLKALNARFKASGWMEVATELSPERGLIWHVVNEGGSAYIRNKVLRKALETEAEAIQKGDPSKAGLTLANYAFAAGDAGDAITKVRIEPRRRDVLLVSGSLHLGRLDADLLMVEGRLSKNPSFWTRHVDVVRRYTRINGVRVPISMESEADVRVAGRSTFAMTYRYDSVNGIDLPATNPHH